MASPFQELVNERQSANASSGPQRERYEIIHYRLLTLTVQCFRPIYSASITLIGPIIAVNNRAIPCSDRSKTRSPETLGQFVSVDILTRKKI
jgi:hypothetical protein